MTATAITLHDRPSDLYLRRYDVLADDEPVGTIYAARVATDRVRPGERIVERRTYSTRWMIEGSVRLRFYTRREALAYLLGHRLELSGRDAAALIKSAKVAR